MAIPYITGAAMAIGMRNIVINARNRRSRTSRRLVDSPRTLPGVYSSWISRLLRLGPPVSDRYSRAAVPGGRAPWYCQTRTIGGVTLPTRGRPLPRVHPLCRPRRPLIGALTGGSPSRLGRPPLPLGAADRPRDGRPGPPLLDAGWARPRRRRAGRLRRVEPRRPRRRRRNLAIPGLFLVLSVGRPTS